MPKRIKVRTLIRAIRKNGYEKGQRAYSMTKHRRDPETGYYKQIPAYCAFGQAGKNLNVDPALLHNRTADVSSILTSRIITLNDGTDKSIPEIADIVENEFFGLMDRYIDLTGVSEWSE